MDTNNKIKTGVSWSLLERIISFLMTTVISVILARLISPDEYGNLALVTVFVNIFANVLITGLGTALVQKREPTREDFDTIFICNLIIGILSYLVMYVAAPWIAQFYQNESLIGITRAVALMIPIASITSVHYAFLQKAMEFRKYCLITLISVFVSGTAGVVAAYFGLEIWALVIYHVGKQLIQTVILLLTSGLNLSFHFSSESFRTLMPYGTKTMATTFVGDSEANVRSLIIGKVFSTADLAYYNLGTNYPKMIISNISTALSRVVFPVFSDLQDDIKKFKDTMRKGIRISLFAVVPILVGLMAVAHQFIYLIYTDKWLEAVPYMQILCLAYITRPYENICYQAIMGSGRSNIIMFDMIVTKLISLALIVISVLAFHSVTAIAWSVAITTVVGVILYAFQVKKYFGYNFSEQLDDTLPIFGLALVMFVAVYLVGKVNINTFALLVMQVIFGICIYIGGAAIMKFDSFVYIKKMLANLISKKKIEKIAGMMSAFKEKD